MSNTTPSDSNFKNKLALVLTTLNNGLDILIHWLRDRIGQNDHFEPVSNENTIEHFET